MRRRKIDVRRGAIVLAWLIAGLCGGTIGVSFAMSGPGSAPYADPTLHAEETASPAGPVVSPDASPSPAPSPTPARRTGPPPPAPSFRARMGEAEDAFEYWDLLLELDSGARIVQRFLITNLGPGKQSAIALGHLVTPGRAEPYAYQNGRRRDRWTLEEDGQLLDVSASTLDLRAPNGRLRITKDDIQIEATFELGRHAQKIPAGALPDDYSVSLLTLDAPAKGRLKAPWMEAWESFSGRAALVHTWSDSAEADVLLWRSDFFWMDEGKGHYLLEWGRPSGRQGGWTIWIEGEKTQLAGAVGGVRHSGRNELKRVGNYPVPLEVRLTDGAVQGVMRITKPWLEIDALSVLPQPFRFFVSLSSQPHQVWADAGFDVTLSPPSDARPPETIERSGKGVAQITFLNERR